ncbi:Hypothetical predicted protein [Octopus vulgaris]|uniref:Uncharacterized protein n=1 Tax=Octopus vulgaris TaxID=6645 RepID=A0AA36F9T1_OCTVU|nr:Hypothetical predicted protein [Octopus vulgaris]
MKRYIVDIVLTFELDLHLILSFPEGLNVMSIQNFIQIPFNSLLCNYDENLVQKSLDSVEHEAFLDAFIAIGLIKICIYIHKDLYNWEKICNSYVTPGTYLLRSSVHTT